MRIYCIGIGGIGLSALARYYAYIGHTVYGSDMADSALIQTLKQEGIEVFIGEDASRITQDIDVVIHTIAISSANSEFLAAKELGLPCKTYPEALGDITKEKTTIAICGTHGKTTTTAMMYHALKACGINPTVIIGSLLSGIGSNFIPGDSEYIIVEACEYKRSFLNLHPTHVLVTNIDADHLDYYKDLEDIHSAFQSFADKVPAHGYVVTHSNVDLDTQGKKMDADEVSLHEIDLTVLGEHNQANAQLVVSLGRALGLPEDKVRLGLKEFKGTWRRLEYKGVTEQGVIVYDDYGHHPTEIRATFQALRSMYKQGEYEFHVFFQPHLFSRTKLFMDEFAEVLSSVEHVYLMPIYAAREVDDGAVTSNMLVDKINSLGGHAELLDTTLAMAPTIEALTGDKTVVVNIGAGDAYAELNKLFFI